MSEGILGYRISGVFDGVKIDKFILDASQLDILGIDPKFFHMLEGCIKHASHEGSTSFPNSRFTIETVLHEIDTPRYVVLRGLRLRNAFYSRYDGKDRHEVKRTNDGKISYEILGFADTSSEAQIVLHGYNNYTCYAHFADAASFNTPEVHAGHCCTKHGCKYGDLWCPVANEQIKAEPGERLCCVEERQYDAETTE